MITAKFRFYLLATLFISIAISCAKDDEEFIIDEPQTTNLYQKGVLIVNEGPFNEGSGTITHYLADSAKVEQEIFQKQNGGQLLGNIVQSVYVHNDLVYIVVNNSNKIEVVDAQTFKSVATINNLGQPRYFLPVSETRAFVSQWGINGIDGSVAVIDLTTNMIVKEIPTGTGTEQMLIASGKLYAANGGFLQSDSTVAVIDIAQESLVERIFVGFNPSDLELDKNENLWVLCKGEWYNDDRPASIAMLENDQVAHQIPLFSGIDNLSGNSDGSKVYYSDYSGVYAINVDDRSTSTFLAQYFYGIDIDPNTNIMYASDAGDFASDGKVFLINEQAVVTDTIDAGVVPTGYWFY